MMDIEKMTIREVADAARKISIGAGGLGIIIDKIVQEIEKLQVKTAFILTEEQIKGK